MKVAILTASDKGSRGEREDRSAKVIKEMLAPLGAEIIAHDIVPDEKEQLIAKLLEYTDQKKADLILTTGGTGLAPRDVTPEATMAVIEREIRGIAEAMRAEGL